MDADNKEQIDVTVKVPSDNFTMALLVLIYFKATETDGFWQPIISLFLGFLLLEVIDVIFALWRSRKET